MAPITGPLLHFHFAWPCAEDRLKAGLITEQQYNKLRFYLKIGAEPSYAFLETCFPRAAEDKKRFAKEHNLPEWDLETVRKFWRYNHRGQGDCAVRAAVIHSVKDGEISIGIEKYPVTNPYSLELEPGDIVYIHRHVIAEVESATAR